MTAQEAAWEISQEFASLSPVKAVCLGGSLTSGTQDLYSDIDLYIYYSEPVNLQNRQEIALSLGSHPIIGHHFWEEGDCWTHTASGIQVDIMYRSIHWIQDEISRVIDRHQSSMGYTTCICYNVQSSQVLFDRHRTFPPLQEKLEQGYPVALQKAIISKNYPVLLDFPFSLVHQIELAQKRKDALSINHRMTAFFAGYFDVLFALNGLFHPGEKRMLDYALQNCRYLPPHFDSRIARVFQMEKSTKNNLVDELSHLTRDLGHLIYKLDLFSQGIGDHDNG